MRRLLAPVRRLFRGGRDASQEQQGVVTLSEVNYFGLAGLLIDQHGTNAKAEADRLAADALREGDMVAVADWFAVEQAITLLANDLAGAQH